MAMTDHWRRGTKVRLTVRQVTTEPLTGEIVGTLIGMTESGVTVSQQIDENGRQGVVLYPWHRVVSVTRTDTDDDEESAVAQGSNLQVGDAGYEVPEVHVMEPPRGSRREGESRDENRGE